MGLVPEKENVLRDYTLMAVYAGVNLLASLPEITRDALTKRLVKSGFVRRESYTVISVGYEKDEELYKIFIGTTNQEVPSFENRPVFQNNEQWRNGHISRYEVNEENLVEAIAQAYELYLDSSDIGSIKGSRISVSEVPFTHEIVSSIRDHPLNVVTSSWPEISRERFAKKLEDQLGKKIY